MKALQSFLITVFLLLIVGCTQYGDDCSTGPENIPEENVADLVPIDSAFFPKQIRQGIRFKSDSIEINFYTTGFSTATAKIQIGIKRENVRCGVSESGYFLNSKQQTLTYNTLTGDKSFSINRRFLLYFNPKQVNTKHYNAHECSVISILGRDFYIDSKDFNVNDSNKVTYYSTLNISGKFFSNVYKVERDTSNEIKKLPFECYYSSDHSGLIGFRITGQPIYLVDN